MAWYWRTTFLVEQNLVNLKFHLMRTMKVTAPLLSLIVFFLIIVNVCYAQGQSRKITVYTDDFAGSDYSLGVGKYDHISLIKFGISIVRSVKVPAGMKVTLYERDNFQGESLILTDDANMRHIMGKGFGQVIQNVSLIVAELPTDVPTGPVATIYKDNFSGASKNLASGYYEFFEFGGIDNDQLSSVKIPKGMKVTLYEHTESGGKSLVLTSDASISFLKEKSFNDATSSIHVEVIPEPAIPVVLPIVVLPQPVPSVVIPVPVVEEIVDDPAFPMVTIYQGNFSGLSKRFAPGRYDMGVLGIGNDQLSSVKVPDGVRLRLYEQAGFKGKSILVEEDANAEYFDANKFNNLTSSLVVELTPRVTIYQDDYAGEVKSFEPGYYYVNELGIGNDELSSVKVLPGVWVLLFDGNNYSGRSLLLTENTSADFIAGRDFDNITSSMIVGKTNDPLPLVTLYQEDFSAPLKKLSPGEYPLLEIGNNTVSSIEIPRGLRVTLYDEGAYGGKSLTLTKSLRADVFKSLGFNDVTSSVIIEQRDPRDLFVTIYTDSYKGIAQELTPGRYLARDLITGDQLSSVRVPEGMQAMLYERDYFKGFYSMIDRNTDYTGFKMFDNLYSSIIVEDIFNPRVVAVPVQIIPPPVEIQEEAPVELAQSPTVVYSYDPPCEMSEKEYYSALKAVESKPFSDDKMATARLVTKEKCLTNEQIRSIAILFNFESQTLEFVEYAYDLATEKSTYYSLDDVFKFMSSKEAFTKFLSSK